MRIPVKRLSAVMVVALALAGCQTMAGRDEGAQVASGSVEDQLAAAQDPGRVAREHFARQDYGLAERFFREAVERSPGDADLWIGLAASYDQLGRFELSDRAYASAAKLRGEDFRLLNNRGYSYLLRGDTARAAGMFEKALAFDPGNVVVANNLRLLREEGAGASVSN